MIVVLEALKNELEKLNSNLSLQKRLIRITHRQGIVISLVYLQQKTVPLQIKPQLTQGRCKRVGGFCYCLFNLVFNLYAHFCTPKLTNRSEWYEVKRLVTMPLNTYNTLVKTTTSKVCFGATSNHRPQSSVKNYSGEKTDNKN